MRTSKASFVGHYILIVDDCKEIRNALQDGSVAKSGDWRAALAKCARLRKQLAFPLGPLPNPRVQVLPETP